MSSGQGPALAHRSVASIRSAPTHQPHGQQQGPSTPHTPPRAISSSYGSPSAIRADDDIIVVELGSRVIRAGFAGDSLPKATLQCGIEQQRRAGDFRAWQNVPRRPGLEWAAEHEIWRSDVRDPADLGLVHDKLDRLLREAFTRHLLIDSRPRRMALIVDSSVPLPLLSTVLDTVFDRFQAPMASLLSPPTMTAVAAGVRSSLVIDLGWEETVVTSIYEYREVKSTRTVRAGRRLIDDLYKKILHRLVSDASDTEQDDPQHVISFEETEDILCRLMWCRASASRSSQRDSAQLETVEEQDETEADTSHGPPRGVTRVPLESTQPPKTVEISMEKMADVCDDTFFDSSTPSTDFDDHELPVHVLVYRHLLQLPIDVRAICMSRIVFTGGCSNILGIKERIIDELTATVDRRGWEPVHGKAVDQLHSNPKLHRKSTGPATATSPVSEAEEIRSGASSRTGTSEQEQDPIEAKIFRNRMHTQPLQGQIRALHSLGPWAGASLMCQLKISAMATIDRELWLQQGLAGASRPSDVDIKVQQRQSIGTGGLIRGSGGHHANWTLGSWGVI